MTGSDIWAAHDSMSAGGTKASLVSSSGIEGSKPKRIVEGAV